jgi:hypothetical protein
MASLPPGIAALIDAEKTIGERPEWDEKNDPRYFEILAPLAIGAVTTGGFEFRVKVAKHFAARDATAQLEYAMYGRRSAVHLWRIDWKPFHIHDNRAFPPDCAFETYNCSHEHPFHDNYIVDEHRMRGSNLPAGRRVEPDPGTLSDFLALCGVRFRIKDIALIRLPPLTADLFWTKR